MCKITVGIYSDAAMKKISVIQCDTLDKIFVEEMGKFERIKAHLSWKTVYISSHFLKAVCKLGQVQRRDMGMIKGMERLPNVK